MPHRAAAHRVGPFGAPRINHPKIRYLASAAVRRSGWHAPCSVSGRSRSGSSAKGGRGRAHRCIRRLGTPEIRQKALSPRTAPGLTSDSRVTRSMSPSVDGLPRGFLFLGLAESRGCRSAASRLDGSGVLAARFSICLGHHVRDLGTELTCEPALQLGQGTDLFGVGARLPGDRFQHRVRAEHAGVESE